MLGLILFWLTEHRLVPWHTFIAEYKFTFYLRTAVDTQKVGQRLIDFIYIINSSFYHERNSFYSFLKFLRFENQQSGWGWT